MEYLHYLTGMPVLRASLSAGFNLFHLFLTRRIRRRSPLEATDRGIAERLRADLSVGPEALEGYLLDTG